jgi:hypothetical protein
MFQYNHDMPQTMYQSIQYKSLKHVPKHALSMCETIHDMPQEYTITMCQTPQTCAITSKIFLKAYANISNIQASKHR